MVILTSLFYVSDARINATSALDVFLISDCARCVSDKNSMFCSAAASDSNFVSNATSRLSIAQKKAAFGASDGAKYCWEGERESLS